MNNENTEEKGYKLATKVISLHDIIYFFLICKHSKYTDH